MNTNGHREKDTTGVTDYGAVVSEYSEREERREEREKRGITANFLLA